MSSASVLLQSSLKHWFSARGFVLVLAAALMPLILTGAWVGTHQRDIAVESLTWEPAFVVEDEPVNVTAVFVNKGRFAVGAFNASLTIGEVRGNSLSAVANNKTLVKGLAPGERTELRLTWTPIPNYYVVLADADPEDVVAEIEETNNQQPEWVEVHFKRPTMDDGPTPPASLGGSGGPSADIGISGLTWTPSVPKPGDNVTFTAVVDNHGPQAVSGVDVTIRAGRVEDHQLLANQETTTPVSLEPGASTTVNMTWFEVTGDPYWVEAFANMTNGTDPNVANNYVNSTFVVDLLVPVDVQFPDPPEKYTIKKFYFNILEFLHIRILLPFIGLFYAAGVLADDKEKGNLTYIVTRPVSRPLIPLLKFAASYVVAAVAVVAGLIGTYFLLLGLPEGKNVGYLTTPILISLVSLFVYGSFFILLGVLVDRPYLIGVGFVIGWETIAGNFVPWVKNLTMSHHLITAIQGWRFDEGLQWLPEGKGPVEALRNISIAAVAFLLLASFVMRRREFDV